MSTWDRCQTSELRHTEVKGSGNIEFTEVPCCFFGSCQVRYTTYVRTHWLSRRFSSTHRRKYRDCNLNQSRRLHSFISRDVFIHSLMNSSKKLLRLPWDTTIRKHVSRSRENTYTFWVWHANNIRHLSTHTFRRFTQNAYRKSFERHCHSPTSYSVGCCKRWKWNISEIMLKGNRTLGAILVAAPHYSLNTCNDWLWIKNWSFTEKCPSWDD